MTTKYKCNECGESCVLTTSGVFPTKGCLFSEYKNRKNQKMDPLWIPYVEISCEDCVIRKTSEQKEV